MDYGEFLNKNSSEKLTSKEWQKRKDDFFNNNIVPKVKNISGKAMQKLYKDYSDHSDNYVKIDDTPFDTEKVKKFASSINGKTFGRKDWQEMKDNFFNENIAPDLEKNKVSDKVFKGIADEYSSGLDSMVKVVDDRPFISPLKQKTTGNAIGVPELQGYEQERMRSLRDNWRKETQGFIQSLVGGVKGSVVGTASDIIAHDIAGYERSVPDEMYKEFGYQPEGWYNVSSALTGIGTDALVFRGLGQIGRLKKASNLGLRWAGRLLGGMGGQFGGHAMMSEYLQRELRHKNKDAWDTLKAVGKAGGQGYAVGAIGGAFGKLARPIATIMNKIPKRLIEKANIDLINRAGAIAEKQGLKLSGEEIAKRASLKDTDIYSTAIQKAVDLPLEALGLTVGGDVVHGDDITLDKVIMNGLIIGILKGADYKGTGIKDLFKKKRSLVNYVDSQMKLVNNKKLPIEVARANIIEKALVDKNGYHPLFDKNTKADALELLGMQEKVLYEMANNGELAELSKVKNEPQPFLENEITIPEQKKIDQRKLTGERLPVSEKTTLAIENAVDNQIKNIHERLSVGYKIGQVDLMDGFDKSVLDGLNGGQRNAVLVRAKEALEKEFGQEPIEKYKQQAEEMLKQEENDPFYTWKKVKNKPMDSDSAIAEYTKTLNDMVNPEIGKALTLPERANAIRTAKSIAEMFGKDVGAPSDVESHIAKTNENIDTILNSKTLSKEDKDFMKKYFTAESVDDVHSRKTFKQRFKVGEETQIRYDEKGAMTKDITEEFANVKQAGVIVNKAGAKVAEDLCTPEASKPFEAKPYKTPIGKMLNQLRSTKYFQNAWQVITKDLPPSFRDHVGEMLMSSRHNATVEKEAFMKEYDDITAGMTKKSKNRVNIELIARQEGTDVDLKRMGLKRPDTLTYKERQVIEYYDKNMKEFANRIQALRRHLGLQPLTEINNYFTLMRDIDKALANGYDPITADERLWNTQSKKAEKTPWDYETRSPDAHMDFIINLDKTVKTYASSTIDYLNMSPAVNQARAILDTTGKRTFTDKSGKEIEVPYNVKTDNTHAYNYINKWLNDIAGVSQGYQAPKFIADISRGLKRNLVVGILGYNYNTIVVQPTALMATVTDYGITGTLKAVGDMYGKQDFMNKNSKHMRSRKSNYDSDVRDNSRYLIGTMKGKIADNSTAMINITDHWTAGVHWFASYNANKKIANTRGWSEKKLYQMADDAVINAHASGDPMHRSPIQRSLMGSLLTTFQTYTISQLQWYKRDVLGIKNPEVSKIDAVKKNVRMVLAISAINTLMEMGGMQTIFPAPFSAFYKQYVNEEGMMDWQMMGREFPDEKKGGVQGSLSILKEFLKPLPIIGGVGDFGINSIYGAVGGKVTKTMEEIGRGDAPRALTSIGQMSGLPLSPVRKSIWYMENMFDPEKALKREKYIESKKKRNVKKHYGE